MSEISLIGLDLGKSLFQLHGVDAQGAVVLRKRLRRAELLRVFAGLPPCLVGMEACATAHHWARELTGLGHEVRLMPPSYVKAYVKRGKTDAADAEAICEAVTRPGMRFVPVKSTDQQAVLMLHRVRSLLVRQRSQLTNALRAHLAEFGIVAPRARAGRAELMAIAADPAEAGLPDLARAALRPLLPQLEAVDRQIADLEAAILAWHKASPPSRALAAVPGIGPLAASALIATVGDPHAFRSGRHFAAWLGLTPRQSGTGGKTHLGRVSKMGDRYLRTLLVLGATALLRCLRRPTHPPALAWAAALLEREPARLATVAIANKTARILWAMMARGEPYRPAGHARTAAT